MQLFQPARGYRFSVDSVLLARFAARWPDERALDLGAGCGVVGLCLLALGGAGRVVGLELQPDMADRARRGAERSGLMGRAAFVCGDLRHAGNFLRRGSFPLVVSNPPYRSAGSGRVSPDTSVAVARHEVACRLDAVVAAAAHVLPGGGALCVVYPAARLADLVWECRAQALEPKVLRLVHPREDGPAAMALLRAVRGAAPGLEVQAPLIVNGASARYTPEAEGLLGPP